MVTYNPFITAKSRDKASKPLDYLLENKLINNKDYVLDFGSGRLRDVFELRKRGIRVKGYDKYADYYTALDDSLLESDEYSVVCCTHIFETIKSRVEHEEILQKIRKFSARKYISLRNDFFSKKSSWQYLEDEKTFFTGTSYLRFYDLKTIFNWFGKHKILKKNNQYILIELL